MLPGLPQPKVVQAAYEQGRSVGSAEAYTFLESIRHLPRDEQRRLLDQRERELQAKVDESRQRAAKAEAEADHIQAFLDDADAITALMARWAGGEYALSRLPHSLMHKVIACAQADRIEYGVRGSEREQCAADFAPRIAKAIPFVIEHDWASAFANASDFADGDYKLPFENTVFELRADGRHIAMVCSDDGLRLFLIQSGRGWFAFKNTDETPAWMPALVRAACIALDAEVAFSEVVRAPEKLNEKREGRGKIALRDYHVIRLSKTRAAPLAESEPTDRRMRLHFVRGHWRRYPTHKAWIKWHLRGDPDLGFIDKHYRL